VFEEWYVNGKLHCIDGPAVQTWFIINDEPVLSTEVWYENGLLHCVDGPAYQEWSLNGEPLIWGQVDVPQPEGNVFLRLEEWYLNGKRHRDDGPALQQWRLVDGVVFLVREDWFWNDVHHRTDGPAFQAWNVVDGVAVLAEEEWYLNGRLIDPQVLRQPVRAIERWWQRQDEQRRQGIEEVLWDEGMTVFPGFMGMLREYK